MVLRERFTGLLMLGIFIAGTVAVAQEPKKDPTTPTPKLKGFLPPFFGKIGLTDDQKQQVYKIQNDFDAKADKLKAELAEMKAEEKKALEKILNADQKEALRKLQTGEKK